MNLSKWKIRTPLDVLGVVCMLGFTLVFVKCSVSEISLLARWKYGIAHVSKVYRSGKGEMLFGYWYDVAGVRHTSGRAWDEKARVGERYVVRYGVFDPDGNDFLYDLPVPDSITEAHGRQWQAFLRHSHYHPPYIRYNAVMDEH